MTTEYEKKLDHEITLQFFKLKNISDEFNRTGTLYSRGTLARSMVEGADLTVHSNFKKSLSSDDMDKMKKQKTQALEYKIKSEKIFKGSWHSFWDSLDLYNCRGIPSIDNDEEHINEHMRDSVKYLCNNYKQGDNKMTNRRKLQIQECFYEICDLVATKPYNDNINLNFVNDKIEGGFKIYANTESLNEKKSKGDFNITIKVNPSYFTDSTKKELIEQCSYLIFKGMISKKIEPEDHDMQQDFLIKRMITLTVATYGD